MNIAFAWRITEDSILLVLKYGPWSWLTFLSCCLVELAPYWPFEKAKEIRIYSQNLARSAVFEIELLLIDCIKHTILLLLAILVSDCNLLSIQTSGTNMECASFLLEPRVSILLISGCREAEAEKFKIKLCLLRYPQSSNIGLQSRSPKHKEHY